MRVAKDGRRRVHLADRVADPQRRRRGGRRLQGRPRRHRAQAQRGAAAGAGRRAQPSGQEHACDAPGDRPPVAAAAAEPRAPSPRASPAASRRSHARTTCSCRATCSGWSSPISSASRSTPAPGMRACAGRVRPPRSIRVRRCRWRWCCTSSRAMPAATGRCRCRPDGCRSTGPSPRGRRRDLRIAWRETGVPARPAGRPGFGTLLIERSLLANGGETADPLSPRRVRLRYPAAAARPTPLSDAVPGRPGRHCRAGRAAAAGGVAGRRVLVVEDEPLIAHGHRGQARGRGLRGHRPGAQPRDGAPADRRRRRPTARCSTPTSPGRTVDELAAELSAPRHPVRLRERLRAAGAARGLSRRAAARQALRLRPADRDGARAPRRVRRTVVSASRR